MADFRFRLLAICFLTWVGLIWLANKPRAGTAKMLLILFKGRQDYAELTMKEYREAFDTYYGSIRNFLYFKTADMGLAEDLAQDTFMKLWDNRKRIDPTTLKSYLYTIAGNLAINQLKRQQLKYKFINQATQDVDAQSPEYLMEMEEYSEKLQSVIASLPEGSREVFLMSRLEDLKYKDIAERLGLSVKAVEKRMSKALQLIREKLHVEV